MLQVNAWLRIGLFFLTPVVVFLLGWYILSAAYSSSFPYSITMGRNQTYVRVFYSKTRSIEFKVDLQPLTSELTNISLKMFFLNQTGIMLLSQLDKIDVAKLEHYAQSFALRDETKVFIDVPSDVYAVIFYNSNPFQVSLVLTERRQGLRYPFPDLPIVFTALGLLFILIFFVKSRQDSAKEL